MNNVLVSVCTLVLLRFKYYFKQSTTYNFLLRYAHTVETIQFFSWFWMFKNMIRWKRNPYIYNRQSVCFEKVYSFRSLASRQ